MFREPSRVVMAVSILHTNDFHGALKDASFQRLAELRETCDLYFDSGDAIKAGNLAIPLRPDPVWKRLSELRCTASTLGNRESHVLKGGFQAKMAGASHPLLAANMRLRNGAPAVMESIEIEVRGMRVGVFGVMPPMVTKRMKTQAASAYLWSDPIKVAAETAERLRPTCDLLIALTHIGYAKDVALAKACPMIDVILGGHSHTVLDSPEQVGSVWIAQGGSHARFAGVYAWDSGARRLTGNLVPLRG